MITDAPVPANEMERIITLSDFDLDYTLQHDNFNDLAKLAAKVAGTPISFVNLIDTFTQWTIANHGMQVEQTPREYTICQYTIAGEEHFEVKDLSADSRFKDMGYMANGYPLRYYFGVPLKANEGQNLGSLCVLDLDLHTLSPEKIELLKIIADEIVNRLNAFKVISGLKHRLKEADETQKKVAHDIRGPLGGIIGLAQVISEQGKDNHLEEVLKFINLIQKSGRSILELADEILSVENPKSLKADEFNLLIFKDKLEKLYLPQARDKNIGFMVTIDPLAATMPFSKNKLLQIAGNLISNAMKFTPGNGKVAVHLSLKIEPFENQLQIKVTDTGVGLTPAAIDTIQKGNATSTDGTGGEHGYGFGLALVKHLIEGLKGTLHIYSTPGEGATFEASLPQAKP
jgi:signal transduction histidine kinase